MDRKLNGKDNTEQNSRHQPQQPGSSEFNGTTRPSPSPLVDLFALCQADLKNIRPVGISVSGVPLLRLQETNFASATTSRGSVQNNFPSFPSNANLPPYQRLSNKFSRLTSLPHYQQQSNLRMSSAPAHQQHSLMQMTLPSAQQFRPRMTLPLPRLQPQSQQFFPRMTSSVLQQQPANLQITSHPPRMTSTLSHRHTFEQKYSSSSKKPYTRMPSPPSYQKQSHVQIPSSPQRSERTYSQNSSPPLHHQLPLSAHLFEHKQSSVACTDVNGDPTQEWAQNLSVRKRERTKNYTDEQSRGLFELCRKDIHIIENSRSQPSLAALKTRVWDLIHQKFVKQFGVQRNAQQLKEKWRRMKETAKSEMMAYYTDKKNGCTDKSPPKFHLDLWTLVQNTIEQLKSSEYDCQDYSNITLALDKENINGEEIMNAAENGNESNGVVQDKATLFDVELIEKASNLPRCEQKTTSQPEETIVENRDEILPSGSQLIKISMPNTD